ncbi:galactose mutarotase-like domain-containing protein [Schizophyllum amplum]|uniref:Glucose-6-phosphate 1-epimerase n=1 Tax=Schizophyllum amplum TaxID=97359 RepID=A0A550CNL9_9AGAR|nr:galactose mutarotase-like domain-containing protein [Auriculariopsis ampla]
MPVEQTNDKVILTHPKGASAEILLYGATVISYKIAGDERLFVSSKAALDGSKAVRGGIPVVFPCFGPPSHPDHMHLPQHGFARTSTWKFDSIVMDNNAGVSVKLYLVPTPEIEKVFDKPFALAYVVTLAEHQLSTDLHVTNTSTQAWEFQALFHNYIRAPADEVTVSPLSALSYYDKTESSDEAKKTPKVEQRYEVDVKKTTDSVYEAAPGKYKILWPGGGLDVRTTNFKDVVVWNPQESGKSMSDMEEGGWKNYVCVEPGHVRGYVRLDAGNTWVGQQVLEPKL